MLKLYKYPRTLHLPFSLGLTEDDKKISNEVYSSFREKEIVVTEKMDGENTSIYSNGNVHARSLTSNHHYSRNWVKQYAASFSYKLPDGWRVCGENLYATHSISYRALEQYFLAFSVFDHTNTCLSWDLTLKFFNVLGLSHPKILYEGTFCENKLQELAKSLDISTCEGFVIRSVDHFDYDDFSSNVAKWVRPNHVKTDKHWMHQKLITNKLAKL